MTERWIHPMRNRGKSSVDNRGKAFVILCLTFGSVMGMLVCSHHSAQYSPFTQRFLHEFEQSQESKSRESREIILSRRMIEQFLIRKSDQGYVVHGVIQVDGSLNPADLQPLNITIQNQREELWTVIIPVHSLRPLGRIRGVRRIEIDAPVTQKERHR